MQAVSRFEKKYLIDSASYFRLRNALVPFLEPDHYTKLGNGSYLVRSLYFDTAQYHAVQERKDGIFGRIKLRLRVYSNDASGRPAVLVELKTKKGTTMEKYSTFVPYECYRQFISGNGWGPDCAGDEPVLQEFERLYRVRGLRPTVLVEYSREGYRARDRSPIRITLDQNVHSTRATHLFPGNLLLKPHRPKHIVLEIKTHRKHQPGWLSRLVRDHSLRFSSNSKYVQGIEIVRPNMATLRRIP